MATNIPQWAQNLPAAVQAKIPEGATGCTKDGDVYIFTKDGAAMSGGKFNADGSVWSASATSSNTPTVSQQQISQQIMQQGGSVFGSGFTGTGGDYSTAWMGGNYNINTNKLMGTAGLLGATSMIASEVPFGLGGLLGSLAMPGIMAGFMKSMSFNFNFDNMFTSTQTQGNTVPEGYEKTNLPGVYEKDGKCIKKDDNGNWLECDVTGIIKEEAKLPEGYAKTTTEGRYKKGDEYIMYDAETRTYVACDKDGNKKVEAARTDGSDASAAAGAGSGDAAATGTGNGGQGVRRGGSPSGWTRVTGNTYNGKTPEQIVSTAFPNLTPEQKTALAEHIKSKNPSVFNSSTPDYSKLDIPSQTWVNNNIVNAKGTSGGTESGPGPKVETQAEFEARMYEGGNGGSGGITKSAYNGGTKYQYSNGVVFIFDSNGRLTQKNQNGRVYTYTYSGSDTRPSRISDKGSNGQTNITVYGANKGENMEACRQRLLNTGHQVECKKIANEGTELVERLPKTKSYLPAQANYYFFNKDGTLYSSIINSEVKHYTYK